MHTHTHTHTMTGSLSAGSLGLIKVLGMCTERSLTLPLLSSTDDRPQASNAPVTAPPQSFNSHKPQMTNRVHELSSAVVVIAVAHSLRIYPALVLLLSLSCSFYCFPNGGFTAVLMDTTIKNLKVSYRVDNVLSKVIKKSSQAEGGKNNTSQTGSSCFCASS